MTSQLSLFDVAPRPRADLALANSVRPWRWRTVLSVPMREFYLQHGYETGWKRVNSDLLSSGARVVAHLKWLNPPGGHLAAVRFLPTWAGCEAAQELWPGAPNVDDVVFPATAYLVARVPDAEAFAHVRSMVSVSKLSLGPAEGPDRSPWGYLHGFRLKAARAFLLHVFGTGIAPGHWMCENAGVFGTSDCDSILGVLEQEQLIERGAYCPEWTNTVAPLAGGASAGRSQRSNRDAFKREIDAAKESYLRGSNVDFAHYLWHPRRENTERAIELWEATS